MEVEKISKAYEEIINPKVLIKMIPDFEEWLKLGTKRDLECTLEAFEKEEMYEECAIIFRKIKKL